MTDAATKALACVLVVLVLAVWVLLWCVHSYNWGTHVSISRDGGSHFAKCTKVGHGTWDC